ncbi:MAG: amidohydrolase [Thermoplasmata archaeon]|nr:amidohydrolase [Thermoplasmata archaeon]
MSVIVRNVLLDGSASDILIEDGLIAGIGDAGMFRSRGATVIDGTGKAAIPGMVNTHTHAAMTLFRSYANDLPLMTWLSERIWPLETKLTDDHVYWGTRLACLEMVRSGTTAFNDMYYHVGATARAVKDSGIRGVISAVFFDMLAADDIEGAMKGARKQVKEIRDVRCPRATAALGPHAPYTVSDEAIGAIADMSASMGLQVHFHLAETKKEVMDYQARTGKRLVQSLDDLGLLSPRLLAAHCVWLDSDDIALLAERGVTASHCPVSNMKLSVGAAMPYVLMRKTGMPVTLGTDGCASNNGLDMFDTMKTAALLQKHATGDPTAMPAHEAFAMATLAGARALGIDAGEIAVGKRADIVLVDLHRPEMTPGHDLVSDLVYSASGGCVDTTICDGEVLMLEGVVEGEEEVLERAREAAADLFSNVE